MKIKRLLIAGLFLMASMPGWAISLTDVSSKIVTPNGDGFNDKVSIVVSTPNAAAVEGRLYDVSGREVASLPMISSGDSATLTWDGRGSNGSPVESGVYIFQITGDSSHVAGVLAVAR